GLQRTWSTVICASALVATNQVGPLLCRVLAAGSGDSRASELPDDPTNLWMGLPIALASRVGGFRMSGVVTVSRALVLIWMSRAPASHCLARLFGVALHPVATVRASFVSVLVRHPGACNRGAES